jgi:hypothetical protein
MITARLIKTDGTVAREWATDRPDLADTADRNYPAGWRVVVCSPSTSTRPEVRDRV